MSNNNNNNAVTPKVISIVGSLDFLTLPVRDESMKIEKSDTVKISCPVIEVKYENIDLNRIYGKKSKSIVRDDNAIANVETFAKAFFETARKEKIVTDENEEVSESYEVWRDRQVLTRIRAMILQRARAEAIRIDGVRIDNAIEDLEKAATAKKADVDSVAKLQALLEKMKSGLSAEDLALLEQAS
jgi:hypothetical protein